MWWTLRRIGLVLCAVCFWVIGQSQSCAPLIQVFDEHHQAVPGAYLFIHENYQQALSDSLGMAKFPSLKPGVYHIHIRSLGFEPEIIDLKHSCPSETLQVALHSSSHHIGEFTVEDEQLKTRLSESTLRIESVDEAYLNTHSGQNFLHQLDDLPGFQVMSAGTHVAKPVIRGFSFNRVAVIDRGIKQEGQQWGWDHGLELDQFDISRAELIRGPTSLAYGSDAVGGVLLLRPPRLPEPNTLEADVLQSFRSVNDLHAQSYALQWRHKTKWIFRFRHSRQDFGDFKVPADSFLYNGFWLPIHEQRLKNTAGQERNFSGTIGYTGDAGYSLVSFSQVHQQIGFFSGAHGIPTANSLSHDGDFRNLDFPYQDVMHRKVLWNSSLKIKESWLEADIGLQHNYRQEVSYPHTHGDFYPPDAGNLEHGFDLKTLSWNLRWRKSGAKWAPKLGASGQIQQNRVSGFSYLIPNFDAWQSGLWAMVTRPLNTRWSFSGGARVDFAGQSVQTFDQVRYNQNDEIVDTLRLLQGFQRNYANWSASLGFVYNPSKQYRWRFNLASSFRLPTVPELGADGVHHGTFRHEQGNPNLLSERGWHLDVAWEAETRNSHWSVTPFFYYFDRFIFLNPTGQFSPLQGAGQLFAYEQAQALQSGLEMSFDTHLGKHWQIKSWLDGVFGYNLTDGYPLPFIPPASGGAEVEFHLEDTKRWKHPFVRINLRGAAPQYLIARNERQTEGYFLVGAALGTSFEFSGMMVDVQAEVQNLLNQSYMVHMNRYRLLNIPEPGRNLFLTLRIHFGHTFTHKSTAS